MDSGAHFYRCDFQVHTPRDTNWKPLPGGSVPTTDEDRKAYAESFIASCRTKGLDAVAITDHHDFTFFPFIKAAAESETDDAGNLIPAEQQIVVFPGMELTLGVPCQALLILDANFNTKWLSSIYPILGITPNDGSEPKHAPTTRLEHIESLTDLCSKLDALDYLEGSYIILPNVGDGTCSIVRKGFQGAYVGMPCVGGYLDGSLEKLKKHDIIDGKQKEWGNKKLGIFQTSDNRREDFTNLGTATTWVKWAVPTAEALRQACLARDTRLFQSEPCLPTTYIESIQVSASKFLGPFNLELNPQYNCVIGGRGTGKSTILEYVRWALCDQPPSASPADELPDYQKKRKSLIEKTLLKFDAVVTVTLHINGVQHTVQKNSRTNKLSLKIGDAQFNECTESDIRRLLPIQAFSQKQLSAVGVRQDELSRFIEAPIKQQMADFRNNVDELKSRIRTTHELAQRKRTLEDEITRLGLEIKSLANQLPELRKQLKGIADDDKQVITDHDKFVQEQTTIQGWENELTELQRIASVAEQEIKGKPSPVSELTGLPNSTLVSSVQSSAEAIFTQARSHIDSIAEMLETDSELRKKFDEHKRAWKSKFDAHNSKYSELRDETSANETVVKQIDSIEKRIASLTESIQEKQTELGRQGTPEDTYQKARGEWIAQFKERAELLQGKCDELTHLSKGRIHATLDRGANIDAALQSLTSTLSGTNIRRAKAESLFAHLVDADDPIGQWESILNELEQLALLSIGESETLTLPATPHLSQAGYTAADLDKITRALSIDAWLTLSLVELGDQPAFAYVRGENDEIAFSDASSGQQATALLTVLLNQTGPPLIIDQPEEDLDNPTMPRIVEEIWNAKANRQVLFTSHNANIVVNGDADLIICCDYRTAGDQTLGEIKHQGAIDVGPINDEITKVMEGGKEAFELRKMKYGF